MVLALEAHRANEAWNAEIPLWNRRPARRSHKVPRGDGSAMPRASRHPEMIGEIRPHEDSRSTLYNSDGQVFSDAGIPVVLFMEDYDINRSGYRPSREPRLDIARPPIRGGPEPLGERSIDPQSSSPRLSTWVLRTMPGGLNRRAFAFGESLMREDRRS
jgi:hypothetical protein